MLAGALLLLYVLLVERLQNGALLRAQERVAEALKEFHLIGTLRRLRLLLAHRLCPCDLLRRGRCAAHEGWHDAALGIDELPGALELRGDALWCFHAEKLRPILGRLLEGDSFRKRD